MRIKGCLLIRQFPHRIRKPRDRFPVLNAEGGGNPYSNKGKYPIKYRGHKIVVFHRKKETNQCKNRGNDREPNDTPSSPPYHAWHHQEHIEKSNGIPTGGKQIKDKSSGRQYRHTYEKNGPKFLI
jgi:hypothetical protein